MTIKNCILDLGGVIIDIDYNLAATAFKKLGIEDFDQIYSKAKQSSLFDNLEKGKITVNDFRNELRNYIQFEVTDEQIDSCWNAMLIGIPQDRFDWIKKLGEVKRLFLLSNTNEIHVNAFRKMNSLKFGDHKFEQLFNRVYLSCEIGMRKPDSEIFDKVVKENNLLLSETIFIDDSVQHIEGAKLYGLHAELLNIEKGEKLEIKYASWLEK
jgi:putative hydrolase of the HAD superfamily